MLWDSVMEHKKMYTNLVVVAFLLHIGFLLWTMGIHVAVWTSPAY
jgi:hypothetical protein